MVWNDLTDAAEKGLDAVENVAEGVGRDIGAATEYGASIAVDVAAGFVDGASQHDTADAMRETARAMDAEADLQVDTASDLYDKAGADLYTPPPAETFAVPGAADFAPPAEYPSNEETEIYQEPVVPPADLGY